MKTLRQGAPVAQLVECAPHVLRLLVLCSSCCCDSRLRPICCVSSPLSLYAADITTAFSKLFSLLQISVFGVNQVQWVLCAFLLYELLVNKNNSKALLNIPFSLFFILKFLLFYL